MPKGIARQGIASRAGVGRRPVAGKFGQADVGYAATYTPGAYTFRPTKSGYWKFVQWGGGDGNANQGSGGYTEYTAYVGVQQSVALSVGAGGASGPGQATMATFPGGKVVTASGGNIAGGAATGGDVNLSGSAAGVAGQGTGGGAGTSGGGAPANLPFHGGAGSAGTGLVGKTPGGGGGVGGTDGGDGMAVVFFVRD